jgi:hypothetical protein
LRELGITTVEYNAIMKDKTLPNAEKYLKLLGLIETKTKDGRKAITELQQSQNALNKDWQDFTARIGPLVVAGLDDVIKTLENVMQAAKDLGNLLGWIGTQAGNIARDFTSGPRSSGPSPTAFHRAGGGPVNPGASYTVGESGPETLTMGAMGGYVTPGSAGGGGNQIHIHVDRGAFIDGPSVDRLANMISQRLSYVTGR